MNNSKTKNKILNTTLIICFLIMVIIITCLAFFIKDYKQTKEAKDFLNYNIDGAEEIIEVSDLHLFHNKRITNLLGYSTSQILVDYDDGSDLKKVVSVIDYSDGKCNLYTIDLIKVNEKTIAYKALIGKEIAFEIPLKEPGSKLYIFKANEKKINAIVLEMVDGSIYCRYPIRDREYQIDGYIELDITKYLAETSKKYKEPEPQLLPDVEEIENDKEVVEQEDNSRINVEELSDWDKVFKNRDVEDVSDAYSFNPKSVKACFNYAEDHEDEIAEDIPKYVGLAGYYGGIGDGTAFMDVESNYSQYAFDETHEYKYRPYKEKISIKATVYDECSFDVIRPGVNKYSYEYIDSLKTLEEKTAFQYKVYNEAHAEMYVDDYSDESSVIDLKFDLTGMMVLNGNNTTEEDFENYARAKTIRIKVGDKTYTKVLEDTYAPQFIDLDYSQKADKPVEVQVEVLDKYPGKVSQDIYVSDIQLGIVFNGSHGR